MPPTLRSSVHGHKASQDINLASSLEATDEDMDMETDQEASSDVEEDAPIGESDQPIDARLQSSTQELLRPLQETAERVGRQVEEFAQVLDRFNSSKESHGQELWQQTWLLMDKYSGITKSTADRIRTSTSSAKQPQKLRKNSSDNQSQKQNLLLESSLWNLEANILPCESPELQEDARFKQDTILANLNRYSTDEDLWNAFLDVDTIANQYEALLDWLQQWRRTTSPQVNDLDLDQYEHTQRGDGAWSMGNIFTQGPIKRQKMARGFPEALPPEDDIRAGHYRKDDQMPLVTHMDPDAALQQDAVLEIEDELYETSAWHASWELLRRGSKPEEVRNWWSERNQLWRALIVQNPALADDPKANAASLRQMNLGLNPEFTALCRELAANDRLQTDYENAVYGVLGGNYEAAAPVCNSVDDHLFALINALIIERYEQFLEAYRRKLSASESTTFIPRPSSIGRVSQFVKKYQVDPATKNEAHQPLKYLEAMLASNDRGELLLQMGHAATRVSQQDDVMKVLFDPTDADLNECAQIAAQDEDMVRIAVHLQLALQPLGVLDDVCQTNSALLENNIVNYIGLLQRHSKYALLPLYASKLSADRQPRVLGRILSQVTAAKERDLQMRLMRQYDIPVNRVIYTICDYARRTWSVTLEAQHQFLRSARIIEYNDRIVRIRSNFIGEMTSDAENQVVQAHEWINWIDVKNWGMAVWLMTALYKTLLQSGKLAAAKELSERVGLAKTSLKVTGMNLSLAALIQDAVEEDEDEAMEGGEEKLASPTKRRKESRPNHLLAKETTNRNALAEQSIVWAHLEHLVQAMDALELWQDLADQVEQLPRHDPRAMKGAKKNLSTALQAVHSAMQPLLDQDFLNSPLDEQEDQDLKEIRNHYLPECVLAYNSALYFAGHAITRQHLVQCMDLAQEIAQNDSLTRAFTESKRMKELVTAFAFDSQALLRANEHGTASKAGRSGKRGRVGEMSGRPDIWQVSMRADAHP